MEKLRMTSPDLTEANIDKLGELFPTAITETLDADGNPQRAVDFDLLRQELSDHIVEGPQERYRLDWPGKRAAAFAANAPIAKTLRPVREESVDFDTTKNLFIEGDNLDALKLLQESYLGKVKLIYIDPPYNTGNDFVYEDDFAESTAAYLDHTGQQSEAGDRLVANTETNGRFHSDWLSMMYPRLKLARNLLTSDGFIMISINDSEQASLRAICDETFGPQNFVAQFIWNSSTGGGIRPKFASVSHQYVLCYARDVTEALMLWAPLSPEAKKMYTQTDEKGVYRDKDFAWKNSSTNPNQRYDIVAPDGQTVHPKPGYIYRFVKERFQKELQAGNVTFKRTDRGPFLDEQGAQARWNIYIKKYLRDGKGAPTTVLPKELVGLNSDGTTELERLFEGRLFENPKSQRLMTYLVQMGCGENDIVLDFFAGSSSTAHAVLSQNALDGGSRRFIMVQLPEKTPGSSPARAQGFSDIAELSRERIRRAAASIRGDVKRESVGRQTAQDFGFRSFHIDTTNMTDVIRAPDATEQLALAELEPSIKSGRTGEDLLFQVLLDWGLELAMPIVKETIAGHQIFDVEEGALIACFDKSIGTDTIRAIANRKPIRVVFRDDGFDSDAQRINVEQILREVSPATEVKAI